MKVRGNEFLKTENSGFLYLLAGSVILVILLMAVVFMVKAYREGIRIGMDRRKLKRVMISSAVFTAVPSLSILPGVAALSGMLGMPMSWLRLSVVGSVPYEGVAATMAANGLGVGFNRESMDAQVFVSMVAVMTAGIIWGGVFCIFGLKKYQRFIRQKKGLRAGRWGHLLLNALFVGMVCAFVGVAFADLRGYGEKPATLLGLLVLVVSGLCMGLFGRIIQKTRRTWPGNFVFSFSMLAGMASAVVFRLLGVR